MGCGGQGQPGPQRRRCRRPQQLPPQQSRAATVAAVAPTACLRAAAVYRGRCKRCAAPGAAGDTTAASCGRPAGRQAKRRTHYCSWRLGEGECAIKGEHTSWGGPVAASAAPISCSFPACFTSRSANASICFVGPFNTSPCSQRPLAGLQASPPQQRALARLPAASCAACQAPCTFTSALDGGISPLCSRRPTAQRLRRWSHPPPPSLPPSTPAPPGPALRRRCLGSGRV